MAKKIDGYIKLQIPAGKANPSPPVGPALGQRGLNIMEFCKQFNAATQSLEQGTPTPGRGFVGKVTMTQVRQIAEQKMADLSAADVDAAAEMIRGSARSMG